MAKQQRKFSTEMMDDSPLYGKGAAPEWVKQLQCIAKSSHPLYPGRLEDDWWKDDDFLFLAMEQNLIEIVPEEGFIVTQKGRDVIEEHGLETEIVDNSWIVKDWERYKNLPDK